MPEAAPGMHTTIVSMAKDPLQGTIDTEILRMIKNALLLSEEITVVPIQLVLLDLLRRADETSLPLLLPVLDLTLNSMPDNMSKSNLYPIRMFKTIADTDALGKKIKEIGSLPGIKEFPLVSDALLAWGMEVANIDQGTIIRDPNSRLQNIMADIRDKKIESISKGSQHQDYITLEKMGILNQKIDFDIELSLITGDPANDIGPIISTIATNRETSLLCDHRSAQYFEETLSQAVASAGDSPIDRSSLLSHQLMLEVPNVSSMSIPEIIRIRDLFKSHRSDYRKLIAYHQSKISASSQSESDIKKYKKESKEIDRQSRLFNKGQKRTFLKKALSGSGRAISSVAPFLPVTMEGIPTIVPPTIEILGEAISFSGDLIQEIDIPASSYQFSNGFSYYTRIKEGK